MSANTASPPIIGISPRVREYPRSLEAQERLAPEWVVSSGFGEAILAAGGLPVLIPLTADESVIEQYVQSFDGFAIPGGEDVSPAMIHSNCAPSAMALNSRSCAVYLRPTSRFWGPAAARSCSMLHWGELCAWM